MPAVATQNDPQAAIQTTSPPEEHPWIGLAREYRAAVRDGDIERVGAMQAPDARVWFEERKGEGRPLDAQGKGPWAEWDAFFRARSTQTEFAIEAGAVRFTNQETNDWLRLIERTAQPYHVFYFIDANGRISGKLIRAIDGAPPAPDRLDEFREWAEVHHPGLMEFLMPDGRIDPHPDKARLWKQRLLEWRHAAGLPDVLGTPDVRDDHK